jgi:PAS domain S-box-containing protein
MTAFGGDFQSTRFGSDTFFRSALESSPDCVQILDLSGTVQFVNRNGVALLGHRAAVDIMGRTWVTFWPEDAQEEALNVLRTAAVAPGPQRFVSPLVTPVGEARHVDSVICALCDSGDRPAALMVTSRDVTDLERARLAAEAREHQAELQSAIIRNAAELANVGGWEVDYRRRVLIHTDEMVRLLAGGPREQPIRHGLAIFDPPDQERVSNMIAQARDTGQRVRLEAPFRRFDGTRGWLRSYGEAVYENGVCVGVRGATMDITDEKAAEEKVRRAEARLQLAAEIAGLRVYDLDLVARTVTHAGSSSPVLEFEPTFDDLYPNSDHLIDPRDRDRVEAQRKLWFETGGYFRAEYRINRPGAEDRWAYSVAKLERDETGKPTRVLSAVLDTTERKKTELEMLRTLQQMREHEARQKLLLDELNHRVKNTLASVQSVALQSLRDTHAPADARDLFIERLMALSATHTLLVKRAWQGATLHDLAQTILEHYGRPYSLEGPDLELDPNYAVSLGMALHELATNAVKHGAWRGQGRVDLCVAHDGETVEVIWRESGGPTVVPPARHGFGARLLERGVAAELGGQVMLSFRPEGLECCIHAPLSERLRVVPTGPACVAAAT